MKNIWQASHCPKSGFRFLHFCLKRVAARDKLQNPLFMFFIQKKKNANFSLTVLSLEQLKRVKGGNNVNDNNPQSQVIVKDIIES